MNTYRSTKQNKEVLSFEATKFLARLKNVPNLRDKVFLFDLDNTLFWLDDTRPSIMANLHKPGAYRHLPLIRPMAFFIESLAEVVGWNHIAFLSHCCPQNVEGSKKDKKARVKEVLPQVRDDMVIVVSAEVPKVQVLEEEFQTSSFEDFILFDDYWQNLVSFTKAGGQAVRVYNGRNHYQSAHWTGLQIEVD